MPRSQGVALSLFWRTFFMLIFAIIALSIFLIAIIILGLTG